MRVTFSSYRPIHLPQIRFGKNVPDSKKEVAMVIDNNGSLTMWNIYSQSINEFATNNVAQVLKKKSVRDHTAPIVITGRAHSGAKLVGRFYRDVPIRYWGTTNGFTLHINHDNEPANQFIQKTDSENQDPEYQTWLKERYSWDLDVVIDSMLNELKTQGFKEATKYGYQAFDITRDVWCRPNPLKYSSDDLKGLDYATVPAEDMLLVSFYPDGTSIMFEKPAAHETPETAIKLDSPELTEHVNSWVENITSTIKSADVRAIMRQGPYKDRIVLYDYIPKDTKGRSVDGKTALVQYLLENKLTSAKAAILTGDSHFDMDYMRKKIYRVTSPGSGRRDVKAYPTQVGQQEDLFKVLSENPRFTQVSPGDLYQGIQTQLTAIGKDLDIQEFNAASLSIDPTATPPTFDEVA